MSSSPATRGRPVEIDPDRLEQVAITLFQERGYDAVSAAEIAEAAGVSRRSLFRYFPTKADLVWSGFAEANDLLSATLAEHTGDEDPREAVRQSLLEVASRTPPELARTRLQIIGTHPELIAFGTGQLHEQSVLIRSHLLDRGVEDLEARVLGDVLSLASFNGFLHWALRTQDEHPGASVERALDVLKDGHTA